MEQFPIPEVLECMHFVASSSVVNKRITRNYEFDLYLSGERDMILDGIHYHISEGDLVFRKPGQSIIGYGDYNMYLITLDFSHTVDKSSKLFRSTSTPQQPTCELDILDSIPAVFTPTHFSEMKLLYQRISQYFLPNFYDNKLQNLYMAELLFLILADANKHNQRILKKSVKGNSYIKNACKYINLNYAKAITINDIASQLSINPNYLIRLFKKELGTTPNQYIIEIRLLHAQSLLAQTDYSIQYVSQQCGFNTPSYFTKCFKRVFNISPFEYRQKAQK